MVYRTDIGEDRKKTVDEFLAEAFKSTDTIGEMNDYILGAEGFTEAEKIAMAFIVGEVIAREMITAAVLEALGGERRD
jgi:hypothetical protein